MVGASISEQGNGSSSILSQKKRRRSSVPSGDGAKRVSTTLFDLNILDCPICYEPLTIPIFQCDNGHLACATCCPKLTNKCPACALPVGHIRNRAMETVLGSIFVPCPNAMLGCIKKLTYGTETKHEKESCRFSVCSCPEFDECNYTGSYIDIYSHYVSSHLPKPVSSHLSKPCTIIKFGESSSVRMRIRNKFMVLVTSTKKVLFALQCFKEPNGIYVTVNCIAPLAPEVDKFSYRISYSFDGHTHTHESPEMKKVLKLSFEIPQEKNFIFVSESLLRGGEMLEMELCISEIKQSYRGVVRILS